MLASGELRVRAAACVLLGSLGPAANDAADALQRSLNDDDAYVRFAAAKALKAIAGSKP